MHRQVRRVDHRIGEHQPRQSRVGTFMKKAKCDARISRRNRACGPGARRRTPDLSGQASDLALASAMPLIRLSQHWSAVICPVRHFWTSMLS